MLNRIILVFLALALTMDRINAKLYKQTPFPASNMSLNIFQEMEGIENKIQCASLCSLQSELCQSYLFDSSAKKCKLFNLINNTRGNFTSIGEGLGFVDLGIMLNGIIITRLIHDWQKKSFFILFRICCGSVQYKAFGLWQSVKSNFEEQNLQVEASPKRV
jgi:hypothetical protein